MRPLPKIGILLPTKNDAGFIGSTLVALFAEIEEYQANGGQVELCCINDGSTDETGELLTRHLSSCACEHHQVSRIENRGVTYSLEEGSVRLSKDCEAYLRCDADARFLRSGWLREMTRFLFSDPRTGVVSPVIIKPRGFIDNFGISFFPNGETWNELGHHYSPTTHGEIREVDATFGVYSLMRAEDWTIDTGYHLWVEDEDQGLELRRRGKKNFVMGYLPVVHYQDYRPARNGVAPEPGVDFRTAHPVRRESLSHFEKKWGFSALAPDMKEVRRLYHGTELLWQENEKSREEGKAIIQAFIAKSGNEGSSSPLLVQRLTECRKSMAGIEGDLERTLKSGEAKSHQLETVRGKLEEAHLTIAKQQELLQRLTQKLTSRKTGAESSTFLEPSVPVLPILSSKKAATVSFPFSQLHEDALMRPDNIFKILGADKNSGANKSQEPAIRRVVSEKMRNRVKPLWERCPAWVDGAVRLEDACFLDQMIETERPDHFYEIGVASGVSSAIILAALSRYAHPDPYWLHSYDLIEVCFFNNAYPVGGAATEMVPELARHWQMNMRTTALDIPCEKKSGKCMYFIDAMHSHPWPVMDLIALLPRLSPGDCVILHDINLPQFSGGQFPHFGAQWLFDHWTGPRFMPDQASPNIGAIIMPDDWSIVPSALWQTLIRPWNPEITVSRDHLIACEERLFQFLHQNNLLPLPPPSIEGDKFRALQPVGRL